MYVYGTSTDSITTSQFVARVRFDRITTGPWRFWTGHRWGDRAALAPMTFAGATPTMPAFVTATDDGVRRGCVRVTAPRPDHSRLDGRPRRRDRGDDSGTVATAIIARGVSTRTTRGPSTSGPAGWAIVYNVNDPVAVATDASGYGGRFVPAPRKIGACDQGAMKRWSGTCAPSLSVT